MTKNKQVLVCRCGNHLLEFEKNTSKLSKYIFLNQITNQNQRKELQPELDNNNPERVRLLICKSCHFMIGVPVVKEDSLAFLLRHGFFSEEKLKSK